jgi:ABC-2 type transport system permease protein
MLKKNLRVLTALFLIALITFSSIMLLNRMGRGLKVDLTEDRIYTLSDETKKILGGLSHTIRLKLFYSRAEAMKGLDSLRAYNNYFFYVRDLLREYASAARGKVILEIIDPKEDTREEREALAYGLRPIPTTDDDRFFFGLVLTTEFGQERTIALLAPDRQQLAEYDITEMIYSAAAQAKKRIGILSTLHADATAMTTGPKAWFVLERLKALYDVTMLPPDSVSFTKLDAIMVIHPKELPDPTLAALDQYVLGGGKLIVFQDPYFAAGPHGAGSADVPGRSGSSLNGLLSAWGCEMPPDTVAADPSFASTMQPGRDGGAGKSATLMALRGHAVSHDDGVNPGVGLVRVYNAGKLQINPVPGIRATPLLRTSESGYSVRAGETIHNAPGASETILLGVRLTGAFRSARAGDAPADKAAGAGPEAGRRNPVVVVFSDVDMLTNAMVRPEAASVSGGNLDLVLATMEGLTGSVSLAAMKARGKIMRPFTAVDEVERDFDRSVAPAVSELQANIASAESELQGLARKANDGEEILLKEEILRNRKIVEGKISRAREDLAGMQHAKRETTDGLLSQFKLFIVFAGPALVLAIPALIIVVRFALKRLRRKQWATAN